MTRPLSIVDLDEAIFDSPSSASATRMIVQLKHIASYADIIPVTKRCPRSLDHVAFKFLHGGIFCNGVLMTDPDGCENQTWTQALKSVLEKAQEPLHYLFKKLLIARLKTNIDVDVLFLPNGDYDIGICVLHNQYGGNSLVSKVFSHLPSDLLDGFSIEPYGNGIAFFPKTINKSRAIAAWIDQDRAEFGVRPIVGLGQSLEYPLSDNALPISTGSASSTFTVSLFDQARDL